MLVALQVIVVRVYEVHCDICGKAVENDDTGDVQFSLRSDADAARRAHIGEHRS
jgi:hypothetical protein